MDQRSNWVTIIPPKGELNAVARLLLTLADPREVLTIGNGTEFLVPPEVADAYHARTTEPVLPHDPPSAPQQPKRRGRAPKLDELEA